MITVLAFVSGFILAVMGLGELLCWLADRRDATPSVDEWEQQRDALARAEGRMP